MSYIVDRTTFLDPFVVDVDIDNATMPGAANHLVRNASDMRGHYADEAALEALIGDGDAPLVSWCVYPGEAGHNCGDIELEGFPKRVFLESGAVVMR